MGLGARPPWATLACALLVAGPLIGLPLSFVLAPGGLEEFSGFLPEAELLPTRVGMMSGLMFGFSFGIGGLAAASFGHLADVYGIALVYKLSALLPLLGVLSLWLPDLQRSKAAQQ